MRYRLDWINQIAQKFRTIIIGSHLLSPTWPGWRVRLPQWYLVSEVFEDRY